jgi:hypothetical protein
MTRWGLLVVLSLVGALVAPARAQIYTPQSSSRLSVSFTTERVGSGRVFVYGEVRNGSAYACERVVVSVEGLDENGRVLSRGRVYVLGVVPSRGSSPFEVRFASPGHERRFRAQIESFEFATAGSRESSSP